MPDLSSTIAGKIVEGGIIPLVYKDLAQPGVRQVGKALSTVLQLGNTLLLPIRLANETARKFEERKFSEIADRFSSIPEQDTIDVSPEIGVPIMENLSRTEDISLRSMYIELLAKAATNSTASQAHPSFTQVISSLSPDEAIFLKHLSTASRHPIVDISLKLGANGGRNVIADLITLPPQGLAFRSNTPLYVSNLAGLGILEIIRDTYLSAPGRYDELISYAETLHDFSNVTSTDEGEWTVHYSKHVLSVLPYGKAFMNACLCDVE
ncbi:DUF4393 domain-containing protein [uncultured Sphingomonas sp.]|uniref:DUF4393 domain-containing protein n=1 Tax=uncultured Sphingomonas sp. TaxID=158754 RepID=UPI00260CD394|nr:DUF4393 domain-containing protein [uncultured Sphingomonas sp.]